MKEIKFRAWDKKNKEFIYEFYLNANRKDLIGIVPEYLKIRRDDYIMTNNKDYEIMQYTGLKDKNGVAEVYEGDIIDTYGNIKGNIYEMDKRETDLVIQGFGTSSWEATNKEAMARGLKYSE